MQWLKKNIKDQFEMFLKKNYNNKKYYIRYILTS